jgi:transposase
MRAYSTDLREGLILAYESGSGTRDEVAAGFGVGRCTVARMLRLQRPDDTLAELAEVPARPLACERPPLDRLPRAPAARPAS